MSGEKLGKATKLLFVHDHVFATTPNGDVFSTGCFPSNVWQRYLAVFDQVTVLARSQSVTGNQERLTPTMKEGVNFDFCQDASNLKSLLGFNKTVNQQIKKAVASADAIIVRLSSELGMLAIKEARRQGKAYAIELVDCPFDSYWNYGTAKARIYAPLMYARVRKVVAQAPFVLYVTEKFLQKRYPNKQGQTVACSNVNIPQPQPEVLAARLRRIEQFNTQGTVTFGQIASLTGTFKGIHTAIEALEKVRQEGIKPHLKILGAGDPLPHKQVAEAHKMEDEVSFDGVLSSGEEVYHWLDDIDVYVHPSFKEGLPRAVIEAMSRGCPVVASSVAGTPELLPAHLVMKPGDSAGLTSRIQYLLSDKSHLQAAASTNFETAKGYSTALLNRRRTEFWQAFKAFAEKGKS